MNSETDAYTAWEDSQSPDWTYILERRAGKIIAPIHLVEASDVIFEDGGWLMLVWCHENISTPWAFDEWRRFLFADKAAAFLFVLFWPGSTLIGTI